MISVVKFSDLCLQRAAKPVQFDLASGKVLVVLGPSGAGKTRLMECIKGTEVPASGKILVSGPCIEAAPPGGRRLRPQAIAQRSPSLDRSAAATEALTAVGLWEVRQTSVEKLTLRQREACELLEPLVSKTPLVLIDGHLDLLSPWSLQATLDLILKRRDTGQSFVIVTSSLQAVLYADFVAVLREGEFRFLGPRDDLLKQAKRQIEVKSIRSSSVEALAKSLQLRVEVGAEGQRVEALESQDLAARLLLEGYGNVSALITQPLSLLDAILRL